ncbi:MAG: hypothetical protein KDC92_12325 [Bacteroidetes bacterium]|nr:hypothetical protein [Bacteroidota bacterium]
MSAVAKKEEIIDYIKNMDESKLEVFYNRWKEEQEIVGYEPDGTPITVADLKDDIKQSEADIENGYFLSAKDARKESLNW